ncbi:MAG TPA: hypothetical protein VGF81_14290 [Solirubrobacteraceae bacterium]
MLTWVESDSPSFKARHDSSNRDDAARVLHSLELARRDLADYFPIDLAGLTAVLHSNTASLWASSPLLPVAWVTTAPAARRYLAGWAGGSELHMLAPAALDRRASNVYGSRQMLELTPVALYARRVIAESNHDLPRRRGPGRIAAELRWAWLIEGSARWFAGQTEHSRPAIARRLREGPAPSFPPGVRDALLLGGTVIDLLAREAGEEAAAKFASRLHPGGARAALTKAFGNRPFQHTEGAWRAHLARMATSS